MDESARSPAAEQLANVRRFNPVSRASRAPVAIEPHLAAFHHVIPKYS
jgi:hypothetical protein